MAFAATFDDIWLVDGVRTPFVDYCGAFGNLSATDLGIKVAREVIARMAVHLQGARQARQQTQMARQARNALDAFGYASIMVRLRDGRIVWQTPLARDLLHRYFDGLNPTIPILQTTPNTITQ